MSDEDVKILESGDFSLLTEEPFLSIIHDSGYILTRDDATEMLETLRPIQGPIPPKLYDYSFTVYPTPARHNQCIYDTFPYLKHRVEMTLSKMTFDAYRQAMALEGFTLHEVTRVPHHEPEVVT